MTRTLALLAVLFSLACGEPPPDHVDPVDAPPPGAFDPGCGSFADPNLSTFNGCTPDNVGRLARVDTTEGPEVYRCTETGFEPVEGRCRFYDADLWCGCGVDDGEGPAP